MIAPVVAARRRVLRLLGDKQAVRILFSDIAPRFADRPGGYTRVLRLAKPRRATPASGRSWNWSASAIERRRAAKPSFEAEPAAAPSRPRKRPPPPPPKPPRKTNELPLARSRCCRQARRF